MSTKASDFNSNTIKSKVVATAADLFTDLDLSFKETQGTKDISPLRDLDAVTNSVKNLLQTNYGERPFQLEVGSNITSLLFEPVDEFTAAALKEEISLCLARYEPRITNVTVLTAALPEQNAFQCTVGFNVITSDLDQEISFYLERFR